RFQDHVASPSEPIRSQGAPLDALAIVKTTGESLSEALFVSRWFRNGSLPHPMQCTDPTGYTRSAGNPRSHMILVAATSVKTSLKRLSWSGLGGDRYLILTRSGLISWALPLSPATSRDADFLPLVFGVIITLGCWTEIRSPSGLTNAPSGVIC